MRIITWNCSPGGVRRNNKYIAAFKPDVLVVQEDMPHEEKRSFSGDVQPTFRDRVEIPSPGGSLTVYSYTDTKIVPVEVDDRIPGFHLYEVQQGDLSFQVAAAWALYTKEKEARYMQVHDGVRRYAEWIQQKPTVILGDFNNGGSFHVRTWRQLLGLIKPLGLVSAYHQFFSEEFGKETRATYYFKGEETTAFHVDYVFVPEVWAEHITKVRVGEHHYWRNLSDHMPIIVDLDF